MSNNGLLQLLSLGLVRIFSENSKSVVQLLLTNFESTKIPKKGQSILEQNKFTELKLTVKEI